MCIIKFADGTSYTAKEWNGCEVISNTALDFSTKNLNGMTITDGDESVTFENAKDNGTGYNKALNEYYYVFAEMTAQEIAQAKTDAQVLYTAMMTDSLLED